jgi:hypothetical protein
MGEECLGLSSFTAAALRGGGQGVGNLAEKLLGPKTMRIVRNINR